MKDSRKNIILILGIMCIGSVLLCPNISATVAPPLYVARFIGEGSPNIGELVRVIVEFGAPVDMSDVYLEVILPAELKLATGSLIWQGDLQKDINQILSFVIVPQQIGESIIQMKLETLMPPRGYPNRISIEEKLYVIVTPEGGSFDRTPPEFRYQVLDRNRKLEPIPADKSGSGGAR